MQLACFLLAFAYASAAITPEPTQKYPHSVVLEEKGNVHLFWDYNDENITFELHAATRGWAALGISPSGGMFGADIMLGWVDDTTGQAQLHDAFAVSAYNTRPVRDPVQNLQLLAHKQCASVTVLKFTRKLKACDTSRDADITDGTIRLIFAYGTSDPPNYNGVTYHGANRGTKSVRLLEPSVSPPPRPSNSRSITLLNPNITVPSASTTYWCQAFQFPKLNSKHHLIEINPVIQKGNEGVVHHILLYRCYHKVSSSLHGYGRDCYTGPMPDNLHECFNMFAAWAIGGGDFLFPSHVGYPVGPDDGPDFLLMETHFDNPRQLSGIRDGSGLELVLTTSLRKYDAGIMLTGALTDASQAIPPNFPGFVNRNYCPSECISKTLSSTTRVFASMLHSHLLGRKIFTRLIRNGKEVESLGYDNHYDFDLQESRLLKKEIEVRATDDIVVDCVYNSAARSGFTLGGLSTQEEMCLSFLYYYPARGLSDCSSGVNPAYYLRFAGATKWTQDYRVVEPARWAGKNFVELLYLMDWRNQTIRDEFQKLTHSENVERFYHCKANGKRKLDLSFGKKPSFTEMAPPATPPCSPQNPVSSNRLQCASPPLQTTSKSAAEKPADNGPSPIHKLRFPITG